MASYDDRTLGHADEADGIQEYDNRLPNWWLALLYGSVVFGVFYAGQKHVWGDWSQEAAYEAEMAAANERWPAREAQALTAASADQLEEGAAIYTSTCVACHGAAMEGGIGAALNDDEWLHGYTLEAITRTVSEGVPAKGMPPWGPVLGPEKVALVSAYVESKVTDGAFVTEAAPAGP